MTEERPQPAPVSAIPYELRIGVTGHRDIADEAAVRRAVDGLLEHIDKTLRDASANPYGGRAAPASRVRLARWWLAKLLSLVRPKIPVAARRTPPEKRTPIDWTVISPLAVGADCIVAEAVLENERIEGERRLEVLLPFGQAEYEKDFAEPDDDGGAQMGPELRRFRQLIKRADQTLVVTEIHRGHPDTRNRVRDDAYLEVGRAVVDACEILIAVWDGEREPHSVGTPGIVEYALGRGAYVFWIDANDPVAAVQCLVPAANVNSKPVAEDTPEHASPWWARTEPVPETAKELSRGFHQLSAYNRDPGFDARSVHDGVEEEAKELLEIAKRARLPNDCIEPLIDMILPQQIRADRLAIRYQNLYTATARWLYRLAAIAVSIPVLQVLFFPHQPWIIVFEVLTLLIILVLLDVGRSEAWHEKWLQDRHLTERLRTALFAAALNVSDSKHDISLVPIVDFYGKIGGWTNNVVTRLTRQASVYRCQIDSIEPIKTFLAEAWIGRQLKYHDDKSSDQEHLTHGAHRIGLVLFVVTLIAASLHALGIGHAEDLTTLTIWVGIGFALAALSIALPAWGVAVHAIDSMLERERMAARSTGMARILRYEVMRDIEDTTSFESLRETVGRVAELMSRENYEWLTALAFHKLHRPG